VSIAAHSRQPANCGYRSAGSNERKERWANLDNIQKSALVCGPIKFDKTARQEAFMQSADCPPIMFPSSVAPDISWPSRMHEAAEAKFGHGHLISLLKQNRI
jgi:hypothetical protein